MNNLMEQFGALGSWQKIDEKFDKNIIKQVNDASCVAAVGAMLAKQYGLNLTQTEILKNIGVWSNSELLAKFLNSKETENGVEWIGGGFPLELKFVKGISTDVWGAMLRRGETVGHAVIIAGMEESGLIIIKDPFDQTTYKMSDSELFEVLSEFVLRRKRRQNDKT